MPDSYPYMISNSKIDSILSKTRSAAKPSKFSHEFLKQLGFLSSNDRAIIPLLKRLGFLTDDGSPTEYYDRLRDGSDWGYVLGERLKDLYKDLFNIDTNIHTKSDNEVKGAITRVTGKDETSVGRYFATFKTLAGLVKFGTSPKIMENPAPPQRTVKDEQAAKPEINQKTIEFSHNLQIQLPATTDVNVYNAIFKSLRDNLIDN